MIRALRDGWLLATGTLTVIRVPMPSRVDRRVSGLAMLLAPIAVLPLGILVAAVCWAGRHLEVNPFATAVLAIGLLAAGSRALHWDGLADTVDGLTASYDAERSLAVMRSGTSGPAGVLAIVVLFGVQAAGVWSLSFRHDGWLLLGVLVCLSRCALTLTCVRGVPAARADGLGSGFAGTVGLPATVVVWLLACGLAWLAGDLRAVLGVVLAAVAVLLLVHRTVRRFGGVTGDVFGAAVESALAAMLLAC